MDIKTVQKKIDLLKQNLNEVIKGKSECIDIITIALLAGGNILMDDVPGVGKTTLAKALAKSIDFSFNRVQFTPDLLPADILGSSIYNPIQGTFDFKKGPVFCNILLADEINRASPRTQSALLEAMSESQATIEGVSYPLPKPFFVIATENPVEFHGTYPLPEAQLDRFLILVNLGYPDYDAEKEILFSQSVKHPLETLEPVINSDDINFFQTEVRKVHVDPDIADYIVKIVTATRKEPDLKLGVSPRGSLMMFRAAQAAAFSSGRDHVIPDDVQRLSPYILPHRVILNSKAKYSGIQKKEVIADIISEVSVPA
ncbi:MoxR family ATPase [bacterium]|nr:MoxR family ATPase [bacterium]